MTPAKEKLANKREANDRINRILFTNRWPSGVVLLPKERELLIRNCLRDGLLIGDQP